MLRATFTCFPGISESAEQKLWRSGCLDWKHFSIYGESLFSQPKSESIHQTIQEAERALDLQRYDYFLHRLPSSHKARLLGYAPEDIVYLDIETTGLSKHDTITTACVYQAGKLDFFITEINLFDLMERLMHCKLVVTFNGTRFDLPIIERQLGIQILIPHLDLLPVMRSLGFKGGLKSIEKQISLIRKSKQNGQDTPLLWKNFQTTGDMDLLKQLLVYNAEDTINLEALIKFAYKQSRAGFPMQFSRPCHWEPPNPQEAIEKYISSAL